MSGNNQVVELAFARIEALKTDHDETRRRLEALEPPLCTCGHVGGEHDLYNRCIVAGCKCCLFTTAARSAPAAQPPVCPDCNGTGKVPDSSGWCDCGCKRKAASPPAGLPPCECCEGKGTGYYIGRKWVCGHCDGSGKAAPLPPPGEPGVYDAATCEAIARLMEAEYEKCFRDYQLIGEETWEAARAMVWELAGQPLPAVEGKP